MNILKVSDFSKLIIEPIRRKGWLHVGGEEEEIKDGSFPEDIYHFMNRKVRSSMCLNFVLL
jgi:hypothetical protein